MGYEKERFAGPVPETLICCVCWEIFKDPIELVCGHILCFACLDDQQVDDKFKCPICRTECDAFQNPNQFFKQSYLGLQVKCQWHRFGCKSVLVIASEAAHEESCDYNGHLPRICPEKCGYTGPPLVGPDNAEHRCVDYLKALVQETRRENALQVRRLEMAIKERERDLLEKEKTIHLIENKTFEYIRKYYALKNAADIQARSEDGSLPASPSKSQM